LDEKEAIRELKRRDNTAFEWIIDHYTRYINTIIYNIIGQSMTASDIEEVASDVFLTLWNNAEKIDAKKLKAYLGSIARNKAKDKLRELDIALHIDDNVILLPNATPEDVMIEQEQQSLIKKAILSMAHPDREIFLRYYYYYQSVSEISDEMGINASTVKTKLARGREKLKKTLTKGGCFDGKENYRPSGLYTR
jgi:RNA polymerase sigma factor, sigma-70 family